MWILYALGSAIFAAMVAVLGKIGLKDIDSTFATTIRAIIMAIFLFLVALLLGKFKGFSLASFGTKAWLFVPNEAKEKPLNFPRSKATRKRKIAIIIARMVVAKVESISLSPILPRTATIAAKIAEPSA